MEAERKTLNDREKMNELERIRHSCAHVMATAILRLWPDAQFASGPPVENGFYYDVDLTHRISPEDFPRIEEEMKREIKANHPFEKIVVSRDQALQDAQSGRLGALVDRPGNPSRFKIGNLADIPEGEPIFADDELTDQPLRSIVAEMVREKILASTGEELPYVTAVVTERWDDSDPVQPRIYCAIYVERNSQKGIIIGKGGAKLKKIGSEARGDIEKMIGTHVYLQLFVKVVADWRNQARDLDEIGVKE